MRLGVQTSSFREMLGKPGDMTDKMIAAMRQLGITECELWEPTLQPAGMWPTSASEASREAVRTWRLAPGLDDIRDRGRKLKVAGIKVFAFNFVSTTKVSDPNQFATPDSFEAGLAMSKQYRVNLDIGHFTAAGFDSVEFIRKHHDRITNLHIKDRKRNEGPNVPFGQGDTPITAVLQLLEREHYPIPAFIEYEYTGTGTATEEVGKCLAYIRDSLTTIR